MIDTIIITTNDVRRPTIELPIMVAVANSPVEWFKSSFRNCEDQSIFTKGVALLEEIYGDESILDFRNKLSLQEFSTYLKNWKGSRLSQLSGNVMISALLVGLGFEAKDIASLISIKPDTVRDHREKACKRLNVKLSEAELGNIVRSEIRYLRLLAMTMANGEDIRTAFNTIDKMQKTEQSLRLKNSLLLNLIALFLVGAMVIHYGYTQVFNTILNGSASADIQYIEFNARASAFELTNQKFSLATLDNNHINIQFINPSIEEDLTVFTYDSSGNRLVVSPVISIGNTKLVLTDVKTIPEHAVLLKENKSTSDNHIKNLVVEYTAFVNSKQFSVQPRMQRLYIEVSTTNKPVILGEVSCAMNNNQTGEAEIRGYKHLATWIDSAIAYTAYGNIDITCDQLQRMAKTR